MAIDESRIESVQSGAEQGAGVRVIEGATTYFAHVDGLDPSRSRARRRGGGLGAARRAQAEPRALRAVRSTPQPIELPPEEVPTGAQGGTSAGARRAGPRRRARGGATARLLRGGAAAGRRRQLRGPVDRLMIAPAHGSGCRPSPAAPMRSRPALRHSGATEASSCSKMTQVAIAAEAAGKALTLLEAGRRRQDRCPSSLVAASVASSSMR